MKIALVVYKDDERGGGSIRVAEILAGGLLALGIDVHVVVAYGGAGRLKESLGNRCILIGAKRSSDLAAWRTCRIIFQGLRPDVIHYIDDAAWIVLALTGCGFPRVMHQHFRPNVGPGGDKRLLRIRLLNWGADRIIAISHGAAKQLTELCGINTEKVRVIHNAISSRYLAPMNPTDLRPDTATRQLGMAARVVADKGIEDALNLLAILPKRYVLTIAGEGPDQPRLEAIAKNLGIESRVNWLGSVKEVSSFYRNIDYYLFMSWYEGFGLSVAEAMYCGVPVVGLLGDGEIAEPEYPLVTGENSALVTRSTVGAFIPEASREILQLLANTLEDLDKDEEKRRRMTENARAWVQDRFAESVFIKRVMTAYAEISRPQ